MTQALIVRLAAQVIANLCGMAPERILNFPADAKVAIKRSLHLSYPERPDDEMQTDRYATVKEAAKVIESFHGGTL
jgi:hypothetical protein